MRIAMFTETFLPSTDGIVTRLLATLRHLGDAGHEVLLFAPAGGPAQYGAARVIGVPPFRFFLYPEKNFALPRPGLGRHLRAFQPDLVHVVNPAFLGLAGIYYAKRLRVPLVASYHTNVPHYARHYRLNWLEPALWWYFRTLHNQASLNLCTSRATLHELAAHGFERLELWDRGVDVDLFSRARRSEEMRRRLCGGQADANTRVLLYVGRLAAEKGIERIRPALARLPDVHFAVVGDGPHRKSLEACFAGTRTTFLGYLHGETLAEAYASADGFIFPSTTETLGLVLFEAMAAGLPVVAADSAPTREVLADGAAGFIFDPHRPDSLVQALCAMFYDPARREAVIRRGRETAAQLDWRGPTEQLLRYYRRVLAQPAPVPTAVPRGGKL